MQDVVDVRAQQEVALYAHRTSNYIVIIMKTSSYCSNDTCMLILTIVCINYVCARGRRVEVHAGRDGAA